MANIAKLLTEHMDVWTAAETEKKSGRGRASGNAGSVYGVKKLRELILELAVRGKLVPQDPNDEPASELLKRIQVEKAKLVAEGKLKKEKPLTPIGEDEKPFELPSGWEQVRICDIAFSQAGFAFKSNFFNELGNGLPLIRIRDVGQEFTGTYYDGDYREEFLVKNEDYLISMDGEFRVAPWKLNDALLNQRVSRLIFFSKDTSQDFVCHFLQNRLRELQGTKAYTTVDHLSGGQISNSVIGFPPLREQHRIVAKVDELMALCDQLEQQHSNAQEAHETLVSQLLATLTQSQNAAEFNANWQRIYAHFDVLFTTEASVDALKKTLLQLAVMGKLVPQDPNDEPASELLKRIQAEKAKLIAEGKLKKEKPLAPIGEDENPFELPKGWEWVRIGEICRPVSSGSTPSAEHFREKGGIPFLKVYNIRKQEIDFEYKPQFIDSSLHQSKLKRSIILPGEVVMNIVGPPLGKVAIIPDTYPEWNCNQAIVFFGLIKPMNNKYVLNFFKEGSYLKDIELIGTAGQDNISVTKSKNILLPVPPLAEQHRIVAKVDALMALCDQLKTRIQQASQQQQTIAHALVAQAVNPQC
jgi:type I restriction enzyme, S subunit